jgi:hypothetical protein
VTYWDNLSEQTPNHLLYLMSARIDTRNVQFTQYSSTCMRPPTQGNSDHSVSVFSRPANGTSSTGRGRRRQLFIFHTTDSSRKLSRLPSQSSYFRYRTGRVWRPPDDNRRDTFSRSIHPREGRQSCAWFRGGTDWLLCSQFSPALMGAVRSQTSNR